MISTILRTLYAMMPAVVMVSGTLALIESTRVEGAIILLLVAVVAILDDIEKHLRNGAFRIQANNVNVKTETTTLKGMTEND